MRIRGVHAVAPGNSLLMTEDSLLSCDFCAFLCSSYHLTAVSNTGTGSTVAWDISRSGRLNAENI